MSQFSTSNKWTNLSFRLRIVIGVTIPMIIGMTFLSALHYYREQQLLTSQTRQFGIQLGDIITDGITHAMQSNNPLMIGQIITKFSEQETIIRLQIVNSVGEIRYDSAGTNIGNIFQQTDSGCVECHQSSASERPQAITLDLTPNILRIATPIYNEKKCHTCHDPQKEIIGVLEVCLSMAKTESQVRQNARFMILSTVVTVLLVTAAISVFMFLMVSRPVKTLVDTMRQAQDGDLDVRVAPRGGDELGVLGRSFDAMIGRLDETSTEVARLHREQMTRSERLASIGEMAASVAHEIKNPLAGLAGATQILSRSFGPDDSRYPVVQEMLKLTDRLDKTIRDLLSFARESEPNWVRANLNDVVEETLFFIRREEGKGSEGVVMDLDPEIPEVPMDPQQLQQVLLNLIINARHAVGPGGRVTVSTSSVPSLRAAEGEVGGPCVEVCVRDDGPGIAPEAQVEIFKPFFTTKNQGTGLGLPISRKIVEAHGGVMHLESAPGQGSAFYVWLRRERSA